MLGWGGDGWASGGRGRAQGRTTTRRSHDARSVEVEDWTSLFSLILVLLKKEFLLLRIQKVLEPTPAPAAFHVSLSVRAGGAGRPGPARNLARETRRDLACARHEKSHRPVPVPVPAPAPVLAGPGTYTRSTKTVHTHGQSQSVFRRCLSQPPQLPAQSLRLLESCRRRRFLRG